MLGRDLAAHRRAAEEAREEAREEAAASRRSSRRSSVSAAEGGQGGGGEGTGQGGEGKEMGPGLGEETGRGASRVGPPRGAVLAVWAAALLLPMLLTAVGAALFYLAFPASLSTAQLDQLPLGAPTHGGAVVAMLLIMGLLLPLPFLPISLGIEAGLRGYLLPRLRELLPPRAECWLSTQAQVLGPPPPKVALSPFPLHFILSFSFAALFSLNTSAAPRVPIAAKVQAGARRCC